MNFMGMGPGELILIIIIALIVLGPGKLPEVARAMGKTMRDFRSITDGFQNELRKEIDAASSPVKDDLQSIQKTLDGTAKSVTSDVEKVTAELNAGDAGAQAGSDTEKQAATSSDGNVPDDSFTEHYQKSQGGEASANGEDGAGVKQNEAIPPDATDQSPSDEDDSQPVEYVPAAPDSEKVERRDE
jgi:Tat protein translocase TatB subunit